MATLTAITTHIASYKRQQHTNTLHDVTSRLASPHLKILIQNTANKTPPIFLRRISRRVYELKPSYFRRTQPRYVLFRSK
jgi:hypothetical protein